MAARRLLRKARTRRRKKRIHRKNNPVEIGDYRLEIIPDTEFRLDGGAMFGVVPRVLWERVSPPDELNRIRLNMNCAFIETGKDRILIETGIGEKWTEKEIAMYGIFRTKPFGQTLFDKTGCTTDDITIVVNTHLHFDHAGGNTLNADCGTRNAEFDTGRNKISSGTVESRPRTGTPASRLPEHGVRKSETDSTIRGLTSADVAGGAHIPQFKNARYFVSKSEFEHACNPHERDRASYLPENWQP